VVYRDIHHNVVVVMTSNHALCWDISSRIYIGIVTLIELVKDKYKSFETKTVTAAWIRPGACPFRDLSCILHRFDNVFCSSEGLRARAMGLNV
jgi:hypothetical protein